MPVIPHEIIAASAGSGKTYQLVRRFVHLLALGAEPASIVAMTFTRKAAGEFFQRIISKLAELAQDPTSATAYFQGAEPAPPADTDYPALLKKLTLCMHRVRLGTLDSFFAAIAACYPFELGLPGTSILDESAAAEAQSQSLDQLLDQLHRNADAETSKLLLQNIKQASFGNQRKSFAATLDGWLEKGTQLWNHSDGINSWGDLHRIWPDGRYQGCPADTETRLRHLRELAALITKPTPTLRATLEELEAEIQTYTPGMRPAKKLEEFFKKSALFISNPNLDIMNWGRAKIPVDAAFIKAWRALLHTLLHREFLVCAHRTRGIAHFLSSFEAHYHRNIRARGQLSFADVPRLLSRFSGQTRDSFSDLWFRLDSRFSHWLFDEFQDTSLTQWEVVAPLMEEVLQDSEHSRSFFAVGDIKQSIYLWREAHPELFAQITNAHPPQPDGSGIHPRSLATSYRSAMPVLDAVNAIFADPNHIESLLPGATRHWQFEAHSTHSPLTGYAALISPVKDPKRTAAASVEDSEEDEPSPEFKAQHHLIARLILDLQPISKNLSCAILTRSNHNAIQMANAIRHLTGMPVVCESQIQPFTDNAVTLTLLSALQLAAHPADSYAYRHLQFTPLSRWFDTDYPVATLASHCATLVQEQGFAAFIDAAEKKLLELEPDLPAFFRSRLHQFYDFAVAYDPAGDRDIDAFITAAREHTIRQAENAGAIQVMTVHKSKGLEFDCVFVADLSRSAMNQLRPDTWLTRQQHGHVQWVLEHPGSLIVQAEPTLAQLHHQQQETAGFESLCRLYVAMTRAKRALYLVAAPPPKKAGSITPENFIRQQLDIQPEGDLPAELWTGSAEDPPDRASYATEWETGDPHWHQNSATEAPCTAHPVGSAASPTQPLVQRLRRIQPSQRRRTPSAEESHRITGKQIFTANRDLGRRLGSLVHELMARIDWIPDSPTAATWEQDWMPAWTRAGLTQDSNLLHSALELIAPLFTRADLRARFRQPDSPTTLWREKAFDFIFESSWVSGIFDRVHLQTDATGRYLSAELIDFKTDHAESPEELQERAEGYRPQLELYRSAISKLTALPPTAISTHLLFLRPQKWVKIH